MSYVHCPTCQRAYNLAAHAACPSCPVPATVVDPAEDIVAAAEQLARALARATPAERAAASERVGGVLAPAPRPQPIGAAADLAGFVAAPLPVLAYRKYAPVRFSQRLAIEVPRSLLRAAGRMALRALNRALAA